MKTQTSQKLISMVIAALLSSIGILIPMISPIKIIIEPASFTLASHVPVFIAMFISPLVAVFVALITSFGFFIAGYPFVVVCRALTHLIFAFVGAYLLKKNGNLLLSPKTSVPFVLFISILHAAAEVFVSTIFYFKGQSTASYLVVVLGLVGVGTLIHSTVDFMIATFIWAPLQKVISIPINAKVKLSSVND